MAERNPVINEWIAKAEGDWRSLLHALKDPVNADPIMFFAQQCIEKYMKACLIACNLEVGRTHDLVDLYKDLKPLIDGADYEEKSLRRLSQGGVDYRYPGCSATSADTSFALAMADQIRSDLKAWVLSLPECAS